MHRFKFGFGKTYHDVDMHSKPRSEDLTFAHFHKKITKERLASPKARHQYILRKHKLIQLSSKSNISINNSIKNQDQNQETHGFPSN